MNRYNRIVSVMMFLVCALVCAAVVSAQEPQVTPPKPDVAERFTIEGQYVRVAYNNEGFATLGYRTAQGAVGEDWILLNVGITLMKDVPDFTLKREALSLKIPDGTVLPLPSQADFNKAGNCRNLVMIDNRINDSINYFPNWVSKPCALRFFAQRGQLAYDQTDLSWERACVGRVYFQIPGKLVPGQYWLQIQFATSMVQVPFRILTKDEEKILSKKWQDFKKALDETMKQ